MLENKNIDIQNCGSIGYQILKLSEDIKSLTEHLKKFKKDHHSKYGLIKKVSKRKSFLRYLKKNNKEFNSFYKTGLEV